MNIKKAVITTAGRGVRLFPMADTVQKAMLPLIDKDGIQKNVTQIIAEEAIEAGIEEICIVCAPGDDKKFMQNFESLRNNLLTSFSGLKWAEKEAEKIKDLMGRLYFAIQEDPKGYGHAVLQAKAFLNGDPFLLLLGDYTYLSDIDESCLKQVLKVALEDDCSVSAVSIVQEHLIGNYGTITGKRQPHNARLYDIEKLIEKPSISLAEMELVTNGIRSGNYLCLFGVHALSSSVIDILDKTDKKVDYNNEQLLLTPALQKLTHSEKYEALEIVGRRYDLSIPYGLFDAQLALALKSKDRDVVLSKMISVMAENARK